MSDTDDTKAEPVKLKTYVRMQNGFYSVWVEWMSARYAELAERGWQVVPYEPPSLERGSTMSWGGAGVAGVGSEEGRQRAERLAERLLVAAYSAGLPIQGEDVRTVVRQARLFYEELANPTEPPAAAAQEGEDGEDGD